MNPSYLRRQVSFTLLLLLAIGFNTQAKDLSYKKDGDYRIIANQHLINDVAYKKGDEYQILVEIPTGTREKWEVNDKTGHIEWEFRDGKPREVKFLGYPGNYGFIPQTLSGDNDPLDIIVLSEAVERGSIQKVKIIGMLKLSDGGESDNKVIAITDNGVFDKIDSIAEMLVKKPTVIPIIKLWFEGYKKPGKMVFLGYEDKKKTIKYIEKAHKNWVREIQK
jgi:inorganic pyrophosphatase